MLSQEIKNTKISDLERCYMDIELSQMRQGYDGKLKRLEISGFSPDIHDHEGLYLQVVEGCGYDVYELTLDEAKMLARALIETVANVEVAFKKLVV